MKQVTIYSTPVCHFCNLAKAFFKEHNISFVEYNVAEDMEKRKEMVEMTGQLGVPVIVFPEGQVVVGFREDIARQALGM